VLDFSHFKQSVPKQEIPRSASRLKNLEPNDQNDNF